MPHILQPGIDFIGITLPFYCNDGRGNFLLHKRSQFTRDEHGHWDFGGGRLEIGEELEACVLREVKEEWGVDGIIQEQLPAHVILRKGVGSWLTIPFFVQVDVHAAKIMEPKKFSEMGIFQLTNLPQPLHTGAQYTMKKYKNAFARYRDVVQ